MSTYNLLDVFLFADLTSAELAEVESALLKKTLKRDEILFNQGDEGDSLIIVDSGRVAIFTPDEKGAGEAIRTFGPGQMFGEMALIDNQPRSTSARAVEDTTILSLNKDSFNALLASNPKVAQAAMAELNGRIRYTTDFIGEMRTWMARIGEGDYDTDKYLKETEDSELAKLAADFVHMAAKVEARENKLKEQLQIFIDQDKRKKEVEEIAESEFFKNLRKQREEQLKKKGDS